LITNNRDTDELTNRLVHFSLDNRDTDELTNRDQFTYYRLITNELTNKPVYLVQSSRSRLVGNELTNS
jgi:hypothetical protein